MSDLTPYLNLPGTAREALTFYGAVFGGTTTVHTFAEMGRDDGPGDAVGHGYLTDGPVTLFASDVAGDEPPFGCQGLMLALLGTASPATLRTWFARLGERHRGGVVGFVRIAFGRPAARAVTWWFYLVGVPFGVLGGVESGGSVCESWVCRSGSRGHDE